MFFSIKITIAFHSPSPSLDFRIQPTSSPTHNEQMNIIEICLYIFDTNATLGVALCLMHEFI
jgi:hypothetical protein